MLDGENLGSSLPKNNSCVACCFYLFRVLMLVQREGLGSVKCSSVHLACGFFKSEWETGVYANFCLCRNSMECL